MLARLVTGIILSAGVIGLVGWGPLWGIWALVELVTVLAMWEWYRFRAGQQGWRELVPAVVLTSSLPLVAWLAPVYLPEAISFSAIVLLTLFVLHPDPVPEAWQRMTFALTGIVYPGMMLAFVALLVMYFGEVGRWYVLLLFAAVWMGDTGAYFVGRFLGRHKLHPKVSPKKTWEGAIGGVLGSIGGVLAVRALFPDVAFLRLLDALAIGVGCAVFEQIGDLAESLFKRSFGVKDSGALLPGHGGILDRIDGLLFAAPFMVVYVQLRPSLLPLS